MELMEFIEMLSRNFFSQFCHQNPELLIRISGEYVYLCPRCIGLHVGFFLTGLLFLLYKKEVVIKQNQLPILILLISVTFFHWLAANLSLVEDSECLRIITGSITGSSFFMFFSFMRNEFIGSRNKAGEFSFRRRETVFIILIVISVYGLVLSKSIFIISSVALIALISNLYQLITFTSKYLVIKLNYIFPKRRMP
jgi:uncharacterized membrane protein